MKKVLCLTIALAMLIMKQCAFAEDLGNAEFGIRYTYIQSLYATIDINAGNANCCGKGRGSTADTTTNILVTLQCRTTGSNSWHVEASWTETANGIGAAYVYETYPVVAGNDYRVKVRCQIKDSNGDVLETAYAYSPIWSI